MDCNIMFILNSPVLYKFQWEKIYNPTLSRCNEGRLLKGSILPIFIFLVLVFLLAETVIAQPEQNEQAVAETGIEFQPRLGEYHYDILWLGNVVGKGVIYVDKSEDDYLITADKKTTGPVDKIFKLRYRGETRIKKEDLFPVEATIKDENRKRIKIQEVEYGDKTDAVKIKETESKKKTHEVEEKEYEFFSDTGVVDIFSAIFLARSFDWQVGERQEFSMFLSSKQYQVTMDCLGKTELDVGGEKIPVWVIKPSARKVSEEGKESLHEDTLVYLSVDESKDLVKVKTKLGIGDVKLRLVKYREQ